MTARIIPGKLEEGTLVGSAQEFLAVRRHCLEVADDCGDPETRTALLKMAAAWSKVAAEHESTETAAADQVDDCPNAQSKLS